MTSLPSYHDICPVQMAGMLSSPLRRLLHKPENILKNLVSDGETAADFGCGPGYFTLQLARQVGHTGKVYAIDLQPAMLNIVREKAGQCGLQDRIILHQAQPTRIDLPTLVDFALAFWMVHEVPDKRVFIAEISSLLKPGGLFLVVEPRMHIPKRDFIESVELIKSMGFQMEPSPSVAISWTQLFSQVD